MPAPVSCPIVSCPIVSSRCICVYVCMRPRFVYKCICRHVCVYVCMNVCMCSMFIFTYIYIYPLIYVSPCCVPVFCIYRHTHVYLCIYMFNHTRSVACISSCISDPARSISLYFSFFSPFSPFLPPFVQIKYRTVWLGDACVSARGRVGGLDLCSANCAVWWLEISGKALEGCLG